MYMNTMSVPVRHPWFNKPSMKRKHSSSAADSPGRALKRRRSGTLERGFASLTLDSAMDADIPPVVDAPAPPRPVSPAIHDITMKTSSWYEPEPDRIVITDLDALSDEEEDTDAPDAVNISLPLLQHIKTRALKPQLPATSQTQALVLFRPFSLPARPARAEEKMDRWSSRWRQKTRWMWDYDMFTEYIHTA
ncbi:hypothetical protein B0H10DRAFT_1190397 [Mycena sp. CBHHK59/15]|nr:hypothetical protein B0H10DRAFT_1190397 [Mycena sp. CBHHK59/15]